MTRNEACAVLDLPPNASHADIDDVYRLLVRVWHPDRFNHSPELQSATEAKLKRINEAYAVLTEGSSSRPMPRTVHTMRYWGYDPRLKPIATLNFFGHAAELTLEQSGITLRVVSPPQPPVFYPSENMLAAVAHRTWIRPGTQFPKSRTTSDASIRIIVADPNGVRRWLKIDLALPNSHSRDVVEKSIVGLCSLAEFSGPASRPQ